MKYLKFRNMNKIKKIADKIFLNTLPKEIQKKIKKSRFLTKLIIDIGMVIFFLLLCIIMYLIKLIPKPNEIFFKILYGFGVFTLIILSLLICSLIIILPFTKLIERISFKEPQITKECISKSCEIIRQYYSLNDNYLLTKCFSSTNEDFINHDVCIFKYEDEIRLTVDIVNGYINGESNLGCYAFKIDELQIYKDNMNDKRVTIINYENEKFILGIRAFSFLNKLINK